ncbi:MAG TPA: hypothetical protein VGK29_13985 [Paludibaculum sp.]
MKLFVVLAVLCLLLAPVVVAQQPKVMVKVDVPFEFYMANTLYPQGSYYIQQTHNGLSTLLSPVERKAKSGYSAASAMSRPTKNADQCLVVFRRYDADHIFLKQIWHGVRQVGWELPMSRSEREHVTVKLVTANRAETLTILAQVR